MKRFVLTLIALGVLAIGVLFPALTWNWTVASDSTSEPTRIVTYDARFDVADDGTMAVTEEIAVEFPGYPSRHGIFRFFDRSDTNEPRLRREPRDVRVLMDGRAVAFALEEQSHGRYTVARIGSATEFVRPGVHTYEISYTIDDVLSPRADGSRFYWNLIPGGWAQSIQEARLTVNLPGSAGDLQCALGAGATAGCQARGDGTERVKVHASNLAPRTPLTVSAAVDHEVATPQPDRLWEPRLDPVLGSNLSTLLIVLAGAAGAGLVALRLVFNAHESNPRYPLLYAPPEGVGPAQASYILTERIDQKAFVATVLHMAERGAVDVTHDSSGWRITPLPGGLDGLDPVTKRTAKMLDLDIGPFHASPKSVGDGAKLKAAVAGLERSVRAWARREGLIATAGLGVAGTIQVVLAAVAAAVIVFFNPFDMSAVALIPGAFAVLGLDLLAPGTSTRRTASGRDFWSRAGGFRRVLTTPSSKQRFEFSGREDLYTAFVPWAIAFGVAEAWAAKYRTEMGVEPPAPAYFAGGYVGAHTSNHVSQMVNDFDQTVSSAISSYQATQSSSGGGGGGGGFSGGGGGGGGGGGSW